MIENRIIKTALNFVGQEEVRGNLGFKDERFQELMHSVGWRKSQAWCSYFTELVWRLAYAAENSVIEAKINVLFSGSAVITLNNFKKAGYGVDMKPGLGSVAVWQNYINEVPHWTGHAGIVVNVGTNNFTSIEGNTNDTGEREGYAVAERTRKYKSTSKNGLVLIGFIKPIAI